LLTLSCISDDNAIDAFYKKNDSQYMLLPTHEEHNQFNKRIISWFGFGNEDINGSDLLNNIIKNEDLQHDFYMSNYDIIWKIKSEFESFRPKYFCSNFKSEDCNYMLEYLNELDSLGGGVVKNSFISNNFNKSKSDIINRIINYQVTALISKNLNHKACELKY